MTKSSRASAYCPPADKPASAKRHRPEKRANPPGKALPREPFKKNGPAPPPPAQAVEPTVGARSGPPAPASAAPLVLIAHSDAALLRLARESLEAIFHCEVRTTSSALGAFDRILQEPFRLLLIDLHLPILHGELLYDLITRAYPRIHRQALTAPPVLWLGTSQDLPRQDALTREARTKALLITPLNLQRLLSTAASLLPPKLHLPPAVTPE